MSALEEATHSPMPIGMKPLTPGRDAFPPVPEIASARAKRLYEEVEQLEQTAAEASQRAHELNVRREAVREADAQAEGRARRQGATAGRRAS